MTGRCRGLELGERRLIRRIVVVAMPYTGEAEDGLHADVT